MEHIYDNFYEVIDTQADVSNFSAENRQRIKSLKLLSMYNEIENFNNQEFQSKPKFRIVSFDEVSSHLK